jgi:hypothetical protein
MANNGTIEDIQKIIDSKLPGYTVVEMYRADASSNITRQPVETQRLAIETPGLGTVLRAKNRDGSSIIKKLASADTDMGCDPNSEILVHVQAKNSTHGRQRPQAVLISGSEIIAMQG